MYCKNCGQEVIETSNFCSNCGIKNDNYKDPIISGMHVFTISDINQKSSNVDWKTIREGIFQIGFSILIFGVTFIIIYFGTPYYIKIYISTFYSNSSLTHNDQDFQAKLSLLNALYIMISGAILVLWKWANSEIFDDSFLLRFFPMIPLIISFYVLTQNESLPISILNIGVYIYPLIFLAPEH